LWAGSPPRAGCVVGRHALVSRNLKTTRGWVQGYNAQAVVVEGQILLAAEISTESLDTANLQPMIETALDELEAAGVTATPETVLADAGYWKNDAIDALVAQGIQTLVAPDADRRKEPRPGRRGGLYDFARRVLATDSGKSSTCGARASWSRSLARRSPTAARTGSWAAAGQPCGRSGGCSRRPTTCSSSHRHHLTTA